MAPRTVQFNRIVHTCHFTPHQLQPSEVLRWAMDAMVAGLNNQARDFRIMVRDYQWSLVVIGFEARWLRPFGFFDASGIEIESGMILHDNRRRQVFGYDIAIRANGEDIIHIVSQAHPVELTGGDALDAVPCGVPDHIRAMFQDDEITRDRAPRFTGPKQRAKATIGEPIGTRQTPFTLHRHETEVADMWQNMALASLSGRARESMAFDGGDARLRDGMAQPVTSMAGELRRPVYCQDRGVIDTQAYWTGDHVAYVHQVRGARRGPSEDSRPVCATIIEHMRAPESE